MACIYDADPISPLGAEAFTDIVFEGNDRSECEAFVHAVRNYARAAGKSRDNDWIVDFVVACLLGDALHWYEELDSAVQNDWNLFRRAILAWHPADVGDSEEEPEPPQSVLLTLYAGLI